jgi:hypothetical protein
MQHSDRAAPAGPNVPKRVADPHPSDEGGMAHVPDPGRTRDAPPHADREGINPTGTGPAQPQDREKIPGAPAPFPRPTVGRADK